MKTMLATLILSASFVSQAFAGSYTSPNPDANSEYNRSQARAYAETYAVTPNSGYYDFTNDGGDCTNFVSQVLFHGGLPEFANVSHSNYSSQTAWYYDGPYIPNRSYSWTHAHYFRYHWANVNNDGYNRAYEYKVYTYTEAADNFWTIYLDLWPGDVVQYVGSDGVTYHTQVMHAYDGSDLYMAQHTNNKMWSSLRNTLDSKRGQVGWFVTYRIKQAAY